MDDVPQNRPQILTTIQYEYFNLEEIYARWVLPFWYSHKRQALPTAIWMSKRSEYLTSIRVLTVASPSSYASVVSQKVKQDFILSRPYYLIEKYPTTPSIYVYTKYNKLGTRKTHRTRTLSISLIWGTLQYHP